MTKKDEFSDIVNELDKKFKEIEAKKAKLDDGIKKIKTHQKSKSPEVKVDKNKEKTKQDNFALKEKITTAIIVFIICQMLLLPICLRFPANFLPMWLVGTFSIGVICIAVIDLG